MDRIISLSIGTTDTEDYIRTFQDVSELACNMGDSHNYVNVTAYVVGAPNDDDDEMDYDEETLYKVRKALIEAVAPYGHGDRYVDDLIHAMQNAGIYFREKRKTLTGRNKG